MAGTVLAITDAWLESGFNQWERGDDDIVEGLTLGNQLYYDCGLRLQSEWK